MISSTVAGSPSSVVDSPKKSSSSKTLKRLAALSYPEAPTIACGISALAINSVTNLSFPFILGRAVDLLSKEDKSDSGKNIAYNTILKLLNI